MPVAPRRRDALRRRLLGWFDAARRELPWRFREGEADPYRVWLSEVMLQQTQVAAVVPYFERFVARFPTLAALAAAPDDEVLALWSGLGYYARCRSLLAAAREVVRERGGELPRTAAGLRALPGFGPYTAGAVASIAFGERAPVVDGNVARVLARLFRVDGEPGARATQERYWALAGELVPAQRPGDFNQALMDLGATVCGKASPACHRCPVAPLCEARAAGVEKELPPSRRRPEKRPLALACALVERDGALLFARRPPGGLFGGLWELPSAEIAPGGDAAAALRGALKEKLGITAKIGPARASASQVLTHRALTLVAYAAEAKGEPRPLGYGDCRFLGRSELSRVGLAAAMAKLLAALRSAPRAL